MASVKATLKNMVRLCLDSFAVTLLSFIAVSFIVAIFQVKYIDRFGRL